jgi:hypothetical protein
MARRRRPRRSAGGWWILGALAAIAVWLGFRWTQGGLGSPAPVRDGESALDGGPPALPPRVPPAPPVAAANGDSAPDAPTPTASAGPGIAARGAAAQAKPPARENLSEDDRKALEAVLDRAAGKRTSR